MDKKLNFSLTIDKGSSIPIYIQLYNYIKNEITAFVFPAGFKLPSIREATSILNISKTTVENTYNQLTVEGYVENQPKRGYFVCNISEYHYSKDFNFTLSASDVLADEIPYINDGVDSESFDINTWKKLYNRVITDLRTNIYSSGSIQGEYILRKEISAFVNSLRGGKTSAEQVIVGAGTQYLLGILTGILKIMGNSKYSAVAIETPGYKKAQYIFEDYFFQIRNIPVGENGISMPALKESDAELIYTSPSHQYPLGSVMSIKKRMELLNWAGNMGGFIIEDDYDGMIRYDGMPIPCLQGLDKNDCVIYLGSFSKTILPSLRISFMIIPRKLIPYYQEIKNRYTQSTSKIDQLVIAEFIGAGYMTKHLRKIRRIYKRKNQLILEYIQKHYKRQFHIVNAVSGFHLVCEVIASKNPTNLLTECKKNNILIEVIDIEQTSNKILFSMNYSGIQDSHIPEFVELLAKIML